jgi:TolA-binding protein
VERELQEIRKEIVEARNLVIKNDHLLKNLGADLKTFGKKQETFERRSWLSSAVAYAIFAGLAITAGLVGAKGWVAQARSEHEILSRRAEEATADAAKVRAELASIQKNGAAAMAAYQQLDAGSADEREKAAQQIGSIDRTKLTPLEAQAIEEHGKEVLKKLGHERFESGRAAFKRKDFADAVAELQKGLSLYPSHPEAGENAYYLGAAAAEVRDWKSAAEGMKRYLETGKSKVNRAYAYYVLGEALDESGDQVAAADALRHVLNEFPDSDYVPFAKRRLTAIRKAGIGGAGGAGGAGGDEAPEPQAAAD